MDNLLQNHQEEIRELFDLKGNLRFEKLLGGIVNSPVLVFQNEVPAFVFKFEKRTASAEKRLHTIVSMKNCGFEFVPNILKNRHGQFLSSFGAQHFYCLEYIHPDPDQPTFWQTYSLEQMLELTAKFHVVARQQPAYEELRRSKLGQFKERVPYFRSPELLQWNAALFGMPEWKEILKNVEYLSSSEFQAIYDRLPVQIIHGDNAPTNLVYAKGKQYFIDLDDLRVDIRLLDFAVFTGWSYLERYLELRKADHFLKLIQKHYGALEPIEEQYFHTIVVFRKIEFLGWLLQRLQKFLSNNDVENITKFECMVKRTLNEIRTIF